MGCLLDQPILSTPQIPDISRAKLRVKLIQEELDELNKAIDDNDLIEVADALADLEYVVAWSILEFGLGSKFADIFEWVHDSNMTKLCNNITEAQDTINRYISNIWWKYIYEARWDKFAVIREDWKAIKSIYYKPVNISQILQ